MSQNIVTVPSLQPRKYEAVPAKIFLPSFCLFSSLKCLPFCETLEGALVAIKNELMKGETSDLTLDASSVDSFKASLDVLRSKDNVQIRCNIKELGIDYVELVQEQENPDIPILFPEVYGDKNITF